MSDAATSAERREQKKRARDEKELVAAKTECERWFAYLKRQEDKSLAIQRLAVERRAGRMDEAEAKRQLRMIDDRCSVTVYDGANLAKAVRVLLKHV